MATFPGPSIFWITLASVAVILTLSTLIGRAWGSLFPNSLAEPARFYLAPVLGIATLTIFAGLIGREFPLGNSVFIPIIILGLTIFALTLESVIIKALRHAAVVSLFGVVCGASVLAPLFVFGAFNAHNDAFTYLVHANWLQHNAFNSVISAVDVTPLNTQVSLYQQQGFRMGSSFLLALAQAFLNLSWSYAVYPAVIVSAIASCCLAMGFPLARLLRSIRPDIRLAVLCLPAFTMGGLVFGANLGFLPQTVGLAFGAALLFAVGPLLRWVSIAPRLWKDIVKTVLPTSLLLACAGFAYSELLPFLLIAVMSSAFLLALRYPYRGKILGYTALLVGLASLLLNKELIRTYAALQTQSNAVVGSPVDWTLLGYVAHALGMHGGAWDIFQWSLPESSHFYILIIGLMLTTAVGAVILGNGRTIWRYSINGIFMPSALILAIFAMGIVYFRYFVVSPFPKGLGQSWSQFKLADWAHPFTMTFVLLGVAHTRKYLKKYFNIIVGVVFAVGMISTTLISVVRTAPLDQYYGGTPDLANFYQEFRQTVTTSCPRTARVYLALNGEHHKFRQMAVYYLPDREVASDWTDDGYIFPSLPADHQIQTLAAGDCVVEPDDQDGWLTRGATIGPFRVGIFDGKGRIQISSENGAYARETDGKNWWHWVEHSVHFNLRPLFIPTEAKSVIVHFEYATRSDQTLTVRLRTNDGSSRHYEIQGKENAMATFEKMINISPNQLTDISIETDGKGSPLGERDSRVAAWIIRNVRITLPTPLQ